jgi:hypothetical protein
MNPHEPPETLSALLDEALASDERRRVEAHLAECAECRSEVARLRQTVALLRRVEPARAPVGFVDRVVAARPRPWYRRVAAALFLPLSVKVPAEVTALLMVALLAVYVFERTPALQQAAREETARTAPGAELAGKPVQREVAEERQAVTAPRQLAERRDDVKSREFLPSAPAAPSPTSAPAVAPSAAPPPAATAPAPVPAAPPAAKTEAPSENIAASGARPEVEARQKALERAAESARAPSASRLAAKRAQPSADVIARVAVKDRDAAERELAQLIARVGGRETDRRRDADATIVEALIPQARYAEFSSGLVQIGPWQVEGERGDLPAQIRVILRLSE